MNLSASEIRVLGCLMEKQRTTPDQYPLSLNALRLACNQSTNREPVVEYDDAILRDALHRLERRGYTRFASGAGSRTPKYRHLLAEALPMGEDEQTVICVLMLRGAQTPGELKQRTERMHAFADLGEVHETLERLIGRQLVARLERRPGQKEERYVQLLQDPEGSAALGAVGGGGLSATGAAAASSGSRSFSVAQAHPASHPEPGRASWEAAPGGPGPAPALGGSDAVAAALGALEERVERLERELADLRADRGFAQGDAGMSAVDPMISEG
jgi:uncharacterized protein